MFAKKSRLTAVFLTATFGLGTGGFAGSAVAVPVVGGLAAGKLAAIPPANPCNDPVAAWLAQLLVNQGMKELQKMDSDFARRVCPKPSGSSDRYSAMDWDRSEPIPVGNPNSKIVISPKEVKGVGETWLVGKGTVGETLTTQVLTYRDDILKSQKTYQLRWYRGRELVKTDLAKNESSYLLTEDDYHQVISVILGEKGKKTGWENTDRSHVPDDPMQYRSIKVYNPPMTMDVNLVSNGALSDPRQDDVLTMEVKNIGPSDASVAYKWLRDGEPIEKDKGNTHTIVDADLGKTVSVVVALTRSGKSEQLTKAREVRVPNVPHFTEGSVKIVGDMVYGKTLSTKLTGLELKNAGSAKPTYITRWYSRTKYAPWEFQKTGDTYLLGDDDINKYIKAEIRAVYTPHPVTKPSEKVTGWSKEDVRGPVKKSVSSDPIVVSANPETADTAKKANTAKSDGEFSKKLKALAEANGPKVLPGKTVKTTAKATPKSTVKATAKPTPKSTSKAALAKSPAKPASPATDAAKSAIQNEHLCEVKSYKTEQFALGPGRGNQSFYLVTQENNAKLMSNLDSVGWCSEILINGELFHVIPHFMGLAGDDHRPNTWSLKLSLGIDTWQFVSIEPGPAAGANTSWIGSK